jgi:hypothetical protein
VSVGITNIVSVSVDNVLRCRCAAKKQTVVEGALKVVEDTLCSHKMGLTWVVHVGAHLLDCVGRR